MPLLFCVGYTTIGIENSARHKRRRIPHFKPHTLSANLPNNTHNSGRQRRRVSASVYLGATCDCGEGRVPKTRWTPHCDSWMRGGLLMLGISISCTNKPRSRKTINPSPFRKRSRFFNRCSKRVYARPLLPPYIITNASRNVCDRSTHTHSCDMLHTIIIKRRAPLSTFLLSVPFIRELMLIFDLVSRSCRQRSWYYTSVHPPHVLFFSPTHTRRVGGEEGCALICLCVPDPKTSTGPPAPETNPTSQPDFVQHLFACCLRCRRGQGL